MQERAHSTLSIMVTLIIACPLLAGAVSSLHGLVKNTVRVQEESQATFNYLRTRALVSGVMRGLDSHRLRIFPRVHKHGVIRFTDGSANPVMKSNSHTFPDSNSDAITSLELNLHSKLLVTACQMNSNVAEFSACIDPNTNFTNSSTETYLGVGLQGFQELTGLASGSGTCRTLSLSASKSMSVIAPTGAAPCDSLLIVPILRHYTLYVDSEENLRFLSHRGDNNVENQPLLLKIGQLNFEAQLHFANSIYGLKVMLTAPHQRQFKWSAVHHLARIDRFNLLLNP